MDGHYLCQTIMVAEPAGQLDNGSESLGDGRGPVRSVGNRMAGFTSWWGITVMAVVRWLPGMGTIYPFRGNRAAPPIGRSGVRVSTDTVIPRFRRLRAAGSCCR